MKTLTSMAFTLTVEGTPIVEINGMVADAIWKRIGPLPEEANAEVTAEVSVDYPEAGPEDALGEAVVSIKADVTLDTPDRPTKGTRKPAKGKRAVHQRLLDAVKPEGKPN